ncbi:hypothetical protein DIT71_17025 [Marinobacter vulgaris]|uniref:EpsG family protein n=1 Tax=Marinobacter vulgaris TaxID=1928331 RepID=A0A2V3ZG98_9GAMM|nr:EpsG family protein [Marinobacter vulgaris]PXX88889.1 hypothetical protein DIT71_17025 [Marinobacter vulgaris]TSJ66680.1 hypothetical protein FPC41_17060 [Marinobacter vulgaris]
MEIWFLVYYLAWTAAVLLLLWVSDIERFRNKILSRASLFGSLLIFSFDSYFRGNRGRDTQAYRDHYLFISENAGLMPDQGPYDFEVGYLYLSFIFGRLGFSFEWFSFFISAFSFVAICFMAYAFRVTRTKLFALVILSGFVFFSYNGLRQWLALLLFYLGVSFFYSQRKRFLVIIYWLGSVAFHLSSVVALATAVGFRAISRLDRLSTLLVYLISIPALVLIFYLSLDVLTGLLGYKVYLQRINILDYSGLGFGWLAQTLLNCLLVVVLVIKRDKFGLLEYLAIMWVFLYLLSPGDQSIMRLAVYFSFAQILVFSRVDYFRDTFSLFVSISYFGLMSLQFVAAILFNAHGAILG